MTAVGAHHRAGQHADPAATRGTPLWVDLCAVAVAWLAARVVVLGADALVGYLHRSVHPLRSVGLLGWDAGYYREIAAHGYGPLPRVAVRFWPLTPMLARAVSETGLSVGDSLLVVNNLAALAAGVLLVRLVRREGYAPAVAAKLPWLLALAPPAYVLVMGYSEGVAIALSVAAFLCYRSRRWLPAVAVGLLAGLSRPTGILLAVPAAVEAVRGWRDASVSQRVSSVAATAAPLAGSGLYLAYVGHRFGSSTLPYRVQTRAGLHGHPGDPLRTVVDSLRGAAHHNIGTALDVPWLLLFAVLLVVMVRRLPASYTVWSAATFAVVVFGNNLDSDQRYLWGSFPFLILVAQLVGDRARTWWAVLTVMTGLLSAYAVLAFTHFVVP